MTPRLPTPKFSRTTVPPQLAPDARPWYLVDADGQTLGRLATRIARVLSGRDRVDQIPFIDNGAHVVVINAAKVRVTGKKMEQKLYRHHTGFMGGLKEQRLADAFTKKPTKPVEEAVYGMLPKNKLRQAMFLRLHVFAGPEHNHEAQQPKPLLPASNS